MSTCSNGADSNCYQLLAMQHRRVQHRHASTLTTDALQTATVSDVKQHCLLCTMPVGCASHRSTGSSGSRTLATADCPYKINLALLFLCAAATTTHTLRCCCRFQNHHPPGSAMMVSAQRTPACATVQVRVAGVADTSVRH